MASVWTYLICDAPHVAGGGARGSLTTARSRTVAQSSDDTASATFTINYFDPTTRLVSAEVGLLKNPRNTDVLVYRDSNIVFRGRLKSTSIDYSEDGARTVTVACQSYKKLLQRRLISDVDCTRPSAGGALSRNYNSGADLGSIVWDLITVATAGASETLGLTPSLTNGGLSTLTPAAMTSTAVTLPSTGGAGTALIGGSGNTGQSRNTVTSINAGATVYDAIEQFAAGDAVTPGGVGFEWDVLPDNDGTLRLYLWPLSNGGRGATAGYVLDYPGVIMSGSTADDTDNYANGVRTSGGDSVSPIYTGGADSGSGLWESESPVTVPAAINAAYVPQVSAFMAAQAKADYARYHAIRPAYSVNIRPGGWNWGDSLPGDTVILQLPNLEGMVSDTQRVISQSFAINDDDGSEVVGLTLGSVPLFTVQGAAYRQREFDARLRQLSGAVFGVGSR